MRLVSTPNSDVLVARTGGGTSSVVGVVAVIAGGGGPIYLGLNSPPSGPGLAPAIVMSVLFVFVGLCIVLYRSERRFDRSAKTMTTVTSIGVPWSTHSDSLDGVDRLRVTKEVRTSSTSSGHTSSKTVFPVRLLYADGNEMELSSPLDYLKARRASETLARFLCLPLEDTSTGTVVVRQPSDLDVSVRERLLADDGGLPPLPSKPMDMRSQVELLAGGGDLRLPADGITAMSMVLIVGGMLAVALFGGFVIRGLFADPSVAVGFKVAAGLFLLFPAVPIAIGVLLMIVRTRVRRHGDVITVSRGLGPLSRRWRFTLEELEEISAPERSHKQGRLRPGPGLALRSDTAHCQVGRYLPTPELLYLKAALEHMVCS